MRAAEAIGVLASFSTLVVAVVRLVVMAFRGRRRKQQAKEN
jgi:hypothetical protein